MSWGLTLPMIGSPLPERELVAAYAKAGVKTPVIALLPTPDVTDASALLDVLRRLGPEA